MEEGVQQIEEIAEDNKGFMYESEIEEIKSLCQSEDEELDYKLDDFLGQFAERLMKSLEGY